MNPTKEQLVKWNGEGLPPVGTVCEFMWSSEVTPIEYKRIVVVGHDEGLCVFRWAEGPRKGEYNAVKPDMYYDDPLFRPIRTPEMIAAEERQVAYVAMINTLADSMGISNIGYRDCDILHILLDAGYRNTSDTLFVLEELVRAYRSVVGLDGAYDPVLIKAEALLK